MEKVMEISSKGKYRLLNVTIIGILFVALVALSNGFDSYGVWHIERVLSPSGWVFKQLNNIAEICIGLVALYFGHRTINHMRSHELLKEVDDCKCDWRFIVWSCTWIVAIAIVIGNALN